MKNKIKKKFLTICHDAGGAEIVSAYVKKNLKRYNFICIAKGPAIKIFKRKKLNRYLISPQEKLEKVILKIKDINIVLVGTSWASSLELDYIKEAKKLGIKTVAYLEHWINYRERFGYPRKNWKNNLPDEIWVGDKYALSLAKKFFKNLQIKYIPNLYFQEIKNEFKLLENKLKINKASGILFMSEPLNVYGGKNNTNLTEHDVLNKILEEISKKELVKDIIIRLHPSEREDKYNKLITKYKNKLNIIKSHERNIMEDLARARIVIGINSMALVIASICGKKTISFIPGNEKTCALPVDGVIKTKSIINLMKVIN